MMTHLGIPYQWLMRDQIKNIRRLNARPYILNMDTTHGIGTHWVMFQKVKDNDGKPSVLYVDSFGRPPVQELVDRLDKLDMPLDYIDDELQDIKSVKCGWFVVAMACYLHAGMTPLALARHLSDTYNHSLDDLHQNDRIVMEEVSRYLHGQ
jgi:hypothetical protein